MNVSVIIPTYNRPQQTLAAITSVFQQTYTNWELLIIDDGSTDHSLVTLKKHCQSLLPEEKYTIIASSHKGVSYSRNLGIKTARYPWLAFLDSDDEWLPEKLEKQVSFLQKNQNFLWLHSEEKWLRNGRYIKRKKIHQKKEGDVFQDCIQQCFIGPSTVIIAKAIFEKIGLFNENFPVCEDYELWLRIARNYPIGLINEELIIKHGGHSDQLSTQFKAMDYWRIKALLPVLKDFLSLRERPKDCQAMINFILNKSEILIPGFKKYGHQKKLKEVTNAVELIQLVKFNRDF